MKHSLQMGLAVPTEYQPLDDFWCACSMPHGKCSEDPHSLSLPALSCPLLFPQSCPELWCLGSEKRHGATVTPTDGPLWPQFQKGDTAPTYRATEARPPEKAPEKE